MPSPAEAGEGIFSRLPAWWFLPLFMAGGLLFRLSVTLWDPQIYPDSLQYMHLAREIRQGVFFARNYDLDQGFIKSRHLPPFYSFLLAPFAGGKCNLDMAGKVLSLVLSVLTFLPLYLVSVKVFSRRAAAVACALFVFHYFSLWYSWPVLSEPAFTFLFMAVMAGSVVALTRPSVWRFAGCGVLSALLYMTRDVGISAAPLLAVGAWIKFRFLDHLPPRRTAVFLGALLGSFLLCSAPYLLHIRLRTGAWNLTAQMSNTSITRQIQSFGGDRYDRDRLPVNQQGTALIGGRPVNHIFSLLRYTPALIKKFAVNMGAYGLELGRKWGPFFVGLLLLGLWGLGREFWRDRNRERLFLGGWVAVWIVDLWALYSLVTPYMVDERYMYPLMVPGLALAAFGICSAADQMTNLWTADRQRLQPAVIAGFFLLMLYALTLWPWLEEPEGIDKFLFLYPGRKGGVLTLILCGLLALLVWSLAPLVRLLPSRYFAAESPSWPMLITAGGLIILGFLALRAGGPLSQFLGFISSAVTPDELMAHALRRSFLFSLPGLLLLAGGMAMGFRLLPGRALSASGSAFLFCVFFTGAGFLSQFYNYLDLHHRMSGAGLAEKYASGYKQAAAEIKAQGLVPPGKVICSRKPFMAYYLDGKWFLDQTQDPPESMPKTIPEVIELLQSGKIDYLAVDSFTLKSIRPLTTALAFDLSEEFPGRLIYSRFFPDYNRVITLYDCRRPPEPLPRRTAAEYYQAARAYFQNDRLPFARRELRAGLQLFPDDVSLWFLELQVLQIYYQCGRRGGMASLLYMPELLPRLVKAAQEYARLAPQDERAAPLRKYWEDLYQRELNYLEKVQKRSGSAARPPPTP